MSDFFSRKEESARAFRIITLRSVRYLPRGNGCAHQVRLAAARDDPRTFQRAVSRAQRFHFEPMQFQTRLDLFEDSVVEPDAFIFNHGHGSSVPRATILSTARQICIMAHSRMPDSDDTKQKKRPSVTPPQGPSIWMQLAIAAVVFLILSAGYSAVRDYLTQQSEVVAISQIVSRYRGRKISSITVAGRHGHRNLQRRDDKNLPQGD